MPSGTIYGTTSNQYIDCKIEWSSVTDIENNTSKVSAYLHYRRNNTGHTTSGTGSFTIFIGDNSYSLTKTLEIGTSWTLAVGRTFTIPHNDDGTKSVPISATGSIPDTTLTSTTCSGTAVLADIPRETSLTALTAPSHFNGTFVCRYTPTSASAYNRLNISVNIGGTFTAVKSINLGRSGTSLQEKSVTFTESELSLIYNMFPNTTQGTLRFTLRTYTSSSYAILVGNGRYREATCKIPDTDTTKPTATMTLSPVSSLSAPFNALYIKGRTKVDANFTNEEAKYGATIKSTTMSVGTKTYGSPWTSEYITTDGKVTVTGTLTDSRGFVRTYKQDVTFLPYASPRLIPVSGESEIICERCDESGTLSESGTYLKIKAKRSYSKVESGGLQKNFCYIRYRYKADGGTYSAWTTILADSATSDEVTTDALLEGNLLATKSYAVQIGVVDTLGETETLTFRIPTDKVYMHRAGSIRSLGIGKYVDEANTFDIAEDITAKFRGDVQFVGEEWVSRALGTNVAESTVNSGRWGGKGVYYRVCAGGKHVYVAFNISFTTSGSTVRAESETIPKPPSYDVYALCPVGFFDGTRGIATVSVSPKGRVNIYAVHKLPGATLSTGDTVSWIDGYIDYWI